MNGSAKIQIIRQSLYRGTWTQIIYLVYRLLFCRAHVVYCTTFAPRYIYSYLSHVATHGSRVPCVLDIECRLGRAWRLCIRNNYFLLIHVMTKVSTRWRHINSQMTRPWRRRLQQQPRPRNAFTNFLLTITLMFPTISFHYHNYSYITITITFRHSGLTITFFFSISVILKI